MQNWLHLLPIVGIWTLTVMAPGPDTLAVVSTSLGRSRRAGLAVAFGCAVATLIWAATSLAGLSLVFERAQWLYHAIRLSGAVYLVVIGGVLLRAACKRHPAARSAATDRIAPASIRRAFRLGLLTDLSNPKAAAFFTSLFAVSVPPETHVEFKLLIVAVVAAIAGAWYAVIATTVSWSPITRLYTRGRRALEATAGLLFIGLGAKLAADR
jgi:threonine/homoserine/homoserine lactone efflux protein